MDVKKEESSKNTNMLQQLYGTFHEKMTIFFTSPFVLVEPSMSYWHIPNCILDSF